MSAIYYTTSRKKEGTLMLSHAPMLFDAGPAATLFPAGYTVTAAVGNATDILGNGYVLGGIMLLAGFALTRIAVGLIKGILRGR